MMAGDKCYLSPETTRTLPLDMEILIILIRFVVLCHTKILAMFDDVHCCEAQGKGRAKGRLRRSIKGHL